jgi:hypothetical protein
MARNELKLDSETSSALDAMRNETPIVEVEAAPVVEEAPVVVEAVPEAEVKETPEPKTVPLAALQETREALKEEKRLNAENQRKTDERLRLLTEVLTRQPDAAKPAEVVIPDPEKDAMGTLKMNQQQLQELMDYKKRNEAKQAGDLQNQQVMNRAQQLESEFVASTPDYGAASQFLLKSRHDELMASGMYQPHQVQQVIQQETLALAQQAIQNGNNPAQIVYAIAKARGYAVVAPKPAETPAAQIERVAAGQAASKSIGQALGAQISSGAKMDSKTLANMSDEQFAVLYNKLSRGERAALMGN